MTPSTTESEGSDTDVSTEAPDGTMTPTSEQSEMADVQATISDNQPGSSDAVTQPEVTTQAPG